MPRNHESLWKVCMGQAKPSLSRLSHVFPTKGGERGKKHHDFLFSKSNVCKTQTLLILKSVLKK